ncbi:MAG: glycosyl transferase group 1 [candidate division WWE3 bacterium GW2011_GWC1_41_7]|uniref:Glycosyl transferase group 1 n=4 Tax=Katanobacteria TaxID=422282 RepID=A0A0G0XAQ8_UNCKA|nr:MAG: WbwZ [candidate division WWE3 bacterium GW2011_GWB1_41_6]KKS21462.1 MAG: glycosyl transferase group 1 [candidate division WWE3 bacterium GW2011_GWC1_41_7]KKS21552.1 MAG: WbwZ [candidate division WWE3 bacterium GW2011_GWA1_41_8]OGC57125.1 MAG: hypothetical protein A2976_04710 [candidate division WWE3 bacterium RIFCSPLOWO2_01_FULL_41_9]
MNVAVFIKSTTFHAGYGGLETQNKVLCEGLASKGHAVTVFSPRKELNIDYTSGNKVNYVFIPSIYKMWVAPWQKKNNWVVRSFEEFKNELKDKQYDLVISQSSAGLGIIRNKKELNIKILAISHGTIMGELKTRLYDSAGITALIRLTKDLLFVLANYFGRQREFVLGADKVVAVSQAVKTALMNETFVPEEKVEVIYNGVDPEKFMGTFELKEGPVKLIYVGRVVRSKGLYNLVHVMEVLRKENIILEVVGDGADLNKLKELVARRDLGPKVKFYGKVPYRDVIKRLRTADVFVLPTLRVEGFPMTIPEAMLSRLPVIASDIGGVSDAVVDGETGFLVRPGDSEALAEKIKAVAQDPNMRAEMGTNGRNRALGHFTMNVMLDKYVEVINNMKESTKNVLST